MAMVPGEPTNRITLWWQTRPRATASLSREFPRSERSKTLCLPWPNLRVAHAKLVACGSGSERRSLAWKVLLGTIPTCLQMGQHVDLDRWPRPSDLAFELGPAVKLTGSRRMQFSIFSDRKQTVPENRPRSASKARLDDDQVHEETPVVEPLRVSLQPVRKFPRLLFWRRLWRTTSGLWR